MAALLSGLPKTYPATVEVLESRGILTLRTATKLLKTFEVKCLGMADEGHENRPVANEAGAGERHQEQRMGERLCFYCRRPGRIRRYCPERRPRDGGGGVLSMAVVGSSKDPKRAPDWSGSPLGTEWIIDGGASRHMTGDI